MLTIKKDLPQLPRQALAGTLQFRAVRNRPVDRQRPIDGNAFMMSLAHLHSLR